MAIVWRALTLEYVHRRPSSLPLVTAELELLAGRADPSLPDRRWPRSAWEWPTTLWPAFEALAGAQAQGHDAAFALSWALRHALFAEGRNVALRHELLAAAEANLDLARFEDDWDRGRHKLSVVDDSRRGWEELRVGGSPTFVLPDGRPVTNPAAGAAEFDEERFVLRRYVPYAGDPRTAYRSLLTAALQHRGPGGG